MIMTLKEIIETLEDNLVIPEGKHIFAVFESNESDVIKGFIVADSEKDVRCPKGNINDYPLLSFSELVRKYNKKL